MIKILEKKINELICNIDYTQEKYKSIFEVYEQNYKFIELMTNNKDAMNFLYKKLDNGSKKLVLKILDEFLFTKLMYVEIIYPFFKNNLKSFPILLIQLSNTKEQIESNEPSEASINKAVKSVKLLEILFEKLTKNFDEMHELIKSYSISNNIDSIFIPEFILEILREYK